MPRPGVRKILGRDVQPRIPYVTVCRTAVDVVQQMPQAASEVEHGDWLVRLANDAQHQGISLVCLLLGFGVADASIAVAVRMQVVLAGDGNEALWCQWDFGHHVLRPARQMRQDRQSAWRGT